MSHSTSVSISKCLTSTSVSLQQMSHFNKFLLSTTFSLNKCLTSTSVSLQQASHFNKCLTHQVSQSASVSLQLVSHFSKCPTSTSFSFQQLSHFNNFLTQQVSHFNKCLTQQARVALRYFIVVTDWEVCNTFMAHLCRNRVVVMSILLSVTFIFLSTSFLRPSQKQFRSS